MDWLSSVKVSFYWLLDWFRPVHSSNQSSTGLNQLQHFNWRGAHCRASQKSKLSKLLIKNAAAHLKNLNYLNYYFKI